MARLLFEAFTRALDDNGDPVSGAKLYVYTAGTTTPVTTYSDSALATPQASPVVADSEGYFPQIYIANGLYKIRVTDAAGVLLREHDRVEQNNPGAVDGEAVFRFKDVASLVADENLTYTQDQGYSVSGGETVTVNAGGYAYEVAASGASDPDLTTAGGVKLTVLPDGAGRYWLDAFNPAKDGSTDDTAVFITTASDGVRYIKLGPGTYICGGDNNAAKPVAGTFNIPSNTVIEGAGKGITILKRPTGFEGRGIFSAENGDGTGTVAEAEDNLVENVVIRGITFLGDVDTLGHGSPEKLNQIAVSGTRNWLIEDCEFIGSQTDGIYIGCAAVGEEDERYRYNSNWTIRRCLFDGVINGADGGRNAISVIDVDGLLIDDCEFRRWSRNDMPGSVCLEPNRDLERILNVSISNCRFYDCAGNRAHIALSLDNSKPDVVRNIRITNNYANGLFTGTPGSSDPGYPGQYQDFVSLYTDEDATSFPDQKINLVIEGNVVEDCWNFMVAPFGHIHGVTIQGNLYDAVGAVEAVAASEIVPTGLGGRISLGNNTNTWTAKDVRILDNDFLTWGTNTLSLTLNCDGFIIARNTLDCNLLTYNDEGAIDENGANEVINIGATDAQSDNIRIQDNRFLSTLTDAPDSAVDLNGGNADWATWTYLRNSGTVTTHRVAALQNDFLGERFSVTSFSVTPDNFPIGTSIFRVEGGSGGPSGTGDTGQIVTTRLTNRTNDSAWQFFYPDFKSGYNLATSGPWYRKQSGASAWDSTWRRAAEERKQGVVTDTTDANGLIDIPHGFTFAPFVALVGDPAGDNAYRAKVFSINSTNIRVLVLDAAGADLTSTEVTIYWEASREIQP